MIHIHGDLYFTHDGGMNFILCRRVITQPGPHVKPENIGEERFDPLGYYPNLKLLGKGAAKHLTMDVLTEAGWAEMEEAAERFAHAVTDLSVFKGGSDDV